MFSDLIGCLNERTVWGIKNFLHLHWLLGEGQMPFRLNMNSFMRHKDTLSSVLEF